MPKADDSTRRALSTRLGSKLRALAGGTPAPAPKPQGKPTAPPAKAPPKPAAAAVSPAKSATMQQAWEALAKACPPAWDQQRVEQEWFRILGELLPGKPPEQVTPAEWAVVLEQAPGKVVPF